MNATRRRNSAVPAPASMPATRACPDEGSKSPPRMRTSVDLPAPFGPITQTISPDSIANDTSASAVTGLPKRRPRSMSRSPAGD